MAKRNRKQSKPQDGEDRDRVEPDEREEEHLETPDENSEGVSGRGMDLTGRSYDDMETMTDIESSSPLAKEPDEEETLDLLLDDADMDDYGEKITPYTTDTDIVDDFVDRQTMATDANDLENRLEEYTQLSPKITGGDVDAGWEYGNEAGDETVGGTVPTPDQDVVDELGEAAGLTYRDDEPLNFDKVGERDQKRWEMNPADVNEVDDQDLESLDELGEAEEKDIEEDDEEVDEESMDDEDNVESDEDDFEEEDEDDDLEEDVDEFDLVDLDEELEDYDDEDLDD